MASVHIAVSRQISCPVQSVFELIQDSEALGAAAGLPMTLLVEGYDRHGQGAVRRVGPPVVGVEETILEVVPGELIRYRISRNGGPIKNYIGQMRTVPNAQGTELSWIMDFDVPFLLAPLLRAVLPRLAALALMRLARRLETGATVSGAA